MRDALAGGVIPGSHYCKKTLLEGTPSRPPLPFLGLRNETKDENPEEPEKDLKSAVLGNQEKSEFPRGSTKPAFAGP